MPDDEYDPRNPAERSLEDYGKLAQKLGEIARKHGLYLQGVAVLPPSDRHGPVMMQASFAVGEVATDALMNEDEGAHDRLEGSDDLAAQFDEIIEGSKQSEFEQIKDDWESMFEEGP